MYNYVQKHQILQEELHSCNSHIRSFKAANELHTRENLKVILHADKALKPQEAHCRTYNLPSASEVAAIIPSTCNGNLDVIVHCTDGRLTRINMCHRSYDSLHYILLFQHGIDGWQIGLKRRNNGRTISPTDFYSY